MVHIKKKNLKKKILRKVKQTKTQQFSDKTEFQSLFKGNT